MRLISVEMLNWASYKGWHKFDFFTPSNRNGYAIFGNNSRGKTSFSDAIKWAMYGEAYTKPIMGSDGKEYREKRPILSAKQEDNPLLNVHAFREGEFDLVVRIQFVHEKVVWTLARVIAPDSPLQESDFVIDDYISLASDSQHYEGKEAQDFILQILPKDINKFFFIDGESVNEYRALIANTEQNLEIRRNIEDILNFPILTKGLLDFEEIRKMYTSQLARLSSDTKRNRKLREKIDALSKIIKDAEENVKIAEEELTGLIENHRRIEQKLSTYKEAENLIEKSRGVQRLSEATSKSLIQTKKDLRRENKDLWIYMLQGKLSKEIQRISPGLDKISEIRYEVSQLKQRQKYLCDAHEGESIPCATCLRLPEPRDAKQKLAEEEELRSIDEKIESLVASLEDHKKTSELYNALQRFNTIDRYNVLEEYESRIGELSGELGELFLEKKKLDGLLEDIDNEEIENLKKEMNQLDLQITKKETHIDRLRRHIEDKSSEKSSYSRDLIGDDGSKGTAVLNKKIEFVGNLEKLWNHVSDNYAQETRVVIEKRATETFKELTNNPEGYDRLELNSGFGLKIIDAEGYVIPAPSPGAQQVVAISLIDALRQTSDIEFPIIFDTPGASIDQDHRDNIIKHFWSKRDTQFVILASSGEFRPDEVENEYAHLLAKTWEIDFDNGVNSTTIKKRLGHE